MLLIMVFSSLRAQNWNEWFRQKKTQIRYLTRQIVELQVYIELGQKGYGIYRDGLQLIGDIKDGDFKLHNDYFASLSGLNPHISNSVAIKEIIVWDEQINIFRQRVSKMELFTGQSSIDQLFAQLANKSNDNVKQLELLINDGNYQLKDEERIEQINKIHAAEYQLYGFAKSTYQDALAYSKQQPKEQREIKVTKKLQGLR